MRTIHLASPTDLEGWRRAARGLALEDAHPASLIWRVGEMEGDLFAEAPSELAGEVANSFHVPRAFLELARNVVMHANSERFGMLYALLWRLRREKGLMAGAVDPLVARLQVMAQAVRREIHKAHAFVRFREVRDEDGVRMVAWFEPEHHILEAAAPFFARRFAAMRWAIMTPLRCAVWDDGELRFMPGVARPQAGQDAVEELWRGYYRAIFNPARLKTAMMRKEMPERYWRNLPEARLITPLIADASRRSHGMVQGGVGPANPRPQRGDVSVRAPELDEGMDSIESLKREAAGCHRCPLYAHATQTVFGEGPRDAAVVLVGEQPGDQEDLAGRPFVGPAGKLLDRALVEAGIERKAVYLTNAVKHFKFEPRGKRRLHKSPSSGEIDRCRWWLDAELAAIQPRLVVALGATAVRGVLKRSLPIAPNRGRLIELSGETRLLITVHPSYLLRLPGEDARAEAYDRFLDDLRIVAGFAGQTRSGAVASQDRAC